MMEVYILQSDPFCRAKCISYYQVAFSSYSTHTVVFNNDHITLTVSYIHVTGGCMFFFLIFVKL